MTAAQKAIKYLAVAFAVFLIVSIFGGIFSAVGYLFGVFEEDGVTEDITVYTVSSDVTALKIEISAANLSIKTGDRFSVESNLKYLTVEEKNGTLILEDRKKNGLRFDNPVLTLYVPKDTLFAQADITTGAGRLQADVLSAEHLNLTLGAGEVKIDKLSAQTSADIEGGTGAITILDGSLTDLQLEMGVGQLNLTAALYGTCEMQLGVGETDIKVLRARELYRINVEKGIGSISIDGETVRDDTKLGDGDDSIEIEGGIGAIKLQFSDTSKE